MGSIGRMLIWVGLALAALGGVLLVAERLGLGRLPGDLVWRRKGVEVHVPIVTSIVLSLALTLLLNLFLRKK